MRVNSLLFLAAILASQQALASDCFIAKTRFEIGFFNGVLTNKKTAKSLARELESRSGYHVTVFYNHTNGLVQDLLEVFEQRMTEMPAGARNAYSYNLFYDFLHGDSKTLTAASVDYPELQNAARKFRAAIPRIEASAIKRTETLADYAEHTQQLKSMLSVTSRAILVAHSQGNLFVNHAFESVDVDRQKRIGIVHVAPASKVLHGKYVLADNDFIIRDLGTLFAPKPNVAIPAYSPFDFTGHGFSEIYINPSLKPYSMVMSDIKAEELKSLPVGIYGTFNGKTTGMLTKNFFRESPIVGSGSVTYTGNTARSTDSSGRCKAAVTLSSSNSIRTTVKREFVDSIACLNTQGVISVERINPLAFVTKWESSASRSSLVSAVGETYFSCN